MIELGTHGVYHWDSMRGASNNDYIKATPGKAQEYAKAERGGGNRFIKHESRMGNQILGALWREIPQRNLD